MDLKEIKQVIDLMKRSELTEFEIEEKDLKLRICRDSMHAPMQVVSQQTPMPAPVAAAAPAEPAAKAPAADDNAPVIKSPMVGTFYRAPNPDSPSFVDIGSEVGKDSVVCIIEAMKVMNEINSELKGTIAEILVENGQAVEFGQPLFKLKA